MIRTAIATALLAAAGVAQAAPLAYSIDDTHTNVTFGWNHLGFSNPTAEITDYTAEVMLDEADLTNSSIAISFKASSIEAGSQKFNEHLYSDDFFNVAEYPNITFNSTAIEMTGDNTMDVTGDLTVLGVTKPVTLDVTLNKIAKHPFKPVRVAGFDATTEFKRSEWGMDKYVPAVSDLIKLRITTELVRPIE
ncbi:YceI family protein [bacterium]|nr:YceI family protein [bacterium]